MTFFKKVLFLSCLVLLCVTQSGCALIQLPIQMFSGLFHLAGQAIAVADSLPKPPPYMFF